MKHGAQSLVDKIHEELVTKHSDLVDIKLNSPVSLVWFLDGSLNSSESIVHTSSAEESSETETDSEEGECRSTGLLTGRVEVVDNEDIDIKRRKEKALRDSNHVKVQTAVGDIFRGTGLILAVPFNAIGSMRFHPAVHESIQRASTICNVSAGYKMWALTGNISPDIDSVFRVENRVDTINESNHIVFSIKSFKTLNKVFLNASVELVNVEESFVKIRKLSHAFSGSQDATRNLSLISVCAHENISDPAALAKLIRMHHPYASVRRIVAHDFNADPWFRGSSLAVKVGTADLFANACKHAEYPYYPDRRVTVIGGDVATIWPGFMDGAIRSGKEAAHKMREYFTPNPKEYNDNKVAPPEAWSTESIEQTSVAPFPNASVHQELVIGIPPKDCDSTRPSSYQTTASNSPLNSRSTSPISNNRRY